MSSSVKVVGIDRLAKVDCHGDRCRVGRGVASVDRVGPGAALSKVIDRALETVLLLSERSMTRSAGIVTVSWPSESGVTVKV